MRLRLTVLFFMLSAFAFAEEGDMLSACLADAAATYQACSAEAESCAKLYEDLKRQCQEDFGSE